MRVKSRSKLIDQSIALEHLNKVQTENDKKLFHMVTYISIQWNDLKNKPPFFSINKNKKSSKQYSLSYKKLSNTAYF